MPPRRFPPPWTVHCSESAYWVRDAAGGTFAYTYFREPAQGTIGTGPVHLTRDEARRIVANIAKLPELLAAQKRPGAEAGPVREETPR